MLLPVRLILIHCPNGEEEPDDLDVIVARGGDDLSVAFRRSAGAYSREWRFFLAPHVQRSQTGAHRGFEPATAAPLDIERETRSPML